MAKRELEEINAGSMADIAFLLLIFFLITTTMNFPKALEERLPQKVPPTIEPPLVKSENVLEILANANDDILIEGQPGKVEEIKDKVIEFYQHPIGTREMPAIKQVTLSSAEAMVNKYTSMASAYPDNIYIQDSLNLLERQLVAVKAIGTYNQITKDAMVTIQLDNATKFKTYLSVLDEIMAGLNELRNELSKEKFNVPYSKIEKSKVAEDVEKVKILQTVYPKNIMKQKSRNVGS